MHEPTCIRARLPTELGETEKNHCDGGEVASAAGDSPAEPVVVVSEEGVGLAAGVAVSVLRSHASSKLTIAKIQMYVFMRTLYLKHIVG
jgi:hypothetical protein